MAEVKFELPKPYITEISIEERKGSITSVENRSTDYAVALLPWT
jgi:hypothetical protein